MLPHRLNKDAESYEDVFQYFQTRALQLTPYGVRWNRRLEKVDGGYTTVLTYLGRNYSSFYTVLSERGKGKTEKMARALPYEVLTVPDCHIAGFLDYHKIPYDMFSGIISNTVEYEKIEQYYGTRQPNRAPVYFMNHVDEGMYILDKIGASDAAMRAFALHPIIQDDKDMPVNYKSLLDCNPEALILAVEYRNIANQYLSNKVTVSGDTFDYHGGPVLGPVKAVNDMLIADKIQNYKDFLLYHHKTHPRSRELEAYFKVWLEALGITNFKDWFDELNELNPPHNMR